MTSPTLAQNGLPTCPHDTAPPYRQLSNSAMISRDVRPSRHVLVVSRQPCPRDPHLHASLLSAVTHRPRILFFGSAMAADCAPTRPRLHFAPHEPARRSPRRRRILFPESRQTQHASLLPRHLSPQRPQNSSHRSTIRTSRPSAAVKIPIQRLPVQPCGVRILHQPRLRRDAARNPRAHGSRRPGLFLQFVTSPTIAVDRPLIFVSWRINAMPRQFLPIVIDRKGLNLCPTQIDSDPHLRLYHLQPILFSCP